MVHKATSNNILFYIFLETPCVLFNMLDSTRVTFQYAKIMNSLVVTLFPLRKCELEFNLIFEIEGCLAFLRFFYIFRQICLQTFKPHLVKQSITKDEEWFLVLSATTPPDDLGYVGCNLIWPKQNESPKKNMGV